MLRDDGRKIKKALVFCNQAVVSVRAENLVCIVKKTVVHNVQ